YTSTPPDDKSQRRIFDVTFLTSWAEADDASDQQGRRGRHQRRRMRHQRRRPTIPPAQAASAVVRPPASPAQAASAVDRPPASPAQAAGAVGRPPPSPLNRVRGR